MCSLIKWICSLDSFFLLLLLPLLDCFILFLYYYHHQNLVEIGGMTLCGAVFRERLLSAFTVVVDQTQDFTDSAYTSHENREKILLICDRLKMELDQLLRIGAYLVS